MSDPDFALNDDGTVTVLTGKVTHRLRRPTIGQLRHFTETQRALADTSVQLLVRVRAIEAAECKQKPKENDSAYFERAATMGLDKAASKRKLDDDYEVQVSEWFRDALVRLSDHDGDVPDLDDMPSFAVDRTVPVRLLNHWRQVPLVPGG